MATKSKRRFESLEKRSPDWMLHRKQFIHLMNMKGWKDWRVIKLIHFGGPPEAVLSSLVVGKVSVIAKKTLSSVQGECLNRF